jgi:U3 small nucleolar RNA-associated protein 14
VNWSVGEGDDESIDEEAWWNEEDEAKWGAVLNPILSRVRKDNGGAVRFKDVPPAVALDSDGEPDASMDGDAADGGSSGAEETPEQVDGGDDGGEEGDDDDDDDDGIAEEDKFDLLDVLDAKDAMARQRNAPTRTTRAAHSRDDDEEEGEEEEEEESEDGDSSGDEGDSADDTEAEAQAAALRRMMEELDGAEGRAAGRQRGPRKGPRLPELADATMGVADNEFGTAGGEGDAAGRTGGAPAEVSLATVMAAIQSDPSARKAAGGVQKQMERLLASNIASAVGSKRKRGGDANPEDGVGLASLAPLAKPVSVPARQRAEREVAYDAVRKDVGTWTELIQINRQAPHLAFSAETDGKVGVRADGYSTLKMATQYTPQSEFEAAVAEALLSTGLGGLAGIGAGDVQVAHREMQQQLRQAAKRRRLEGGETEGMGDAEGDAGDSGDDLAAAELDAEAFEGRQKELARMRALLFYDEIKRRRQNKIKSKAYRKLKAR